MGILLSCNKTLAIGGTWEKKEKKKTICPLVENQSYIIYIYIYI